MAVAMATNRLCTCKSNEQVTADVAQVDPISQIVHLLVNKLWNVHATSHRRRLMKFDSINFWCSQNIGLTLSDRRVPGNHSVLERIQHTGRQSSKFYELDFW